MNGIQVNVPANGKAKEPMPVKIVSIDISTVELLHFTLRLILVFGAIAALFGAVYFVIMAVVNVMT